MATIGLCMIVKNEAHVIERCLEKLLALIDHVVISDTGSTDETQQVIRDFLAKHHLPGEVFDTPWQDFAHNRSVAMAKMREYPEVDYALMLDADNYLAFNSNFDAVKFKASLDADLYDVAVRTASTIHYAPLLFSNRIPFFYKAVLHEYLECPWQVTRQTATGFVSVQVQDSARNQNPRKYQDDAEVLERVLLTETDSFLTTRYTFYLGQSYRDAGERESALDAYRRRSVLGGWAEEVFISHLMIGNLQAQLGHADAEVVQSYLDAFEACPTRAESLHAAAVFSRSRNKHQQGYLFSKHGLGIPMPQAPLFGEIWIYEYGLLDELSIAAFWVGQYKESFDACVRLLKNPRFPADQRARVRQNAMYSVERLNKPNLANLLPVD